MEKYVKYGVERWRLMETGVVPLLEINLEGLLTSIERRCGLKLPRRVVEAHLDADHDVLFVRFKEPDKAEVGEPLETEAVAILFAEEGTDEITALEVIGVSELLRELSC